ncbi:TPA: acyltransferase family protein [Escherichia coli]|uniref:acyltransferase family protein n=2 Tax=Escherichia coli TaxID=562 RepID=UPI001EEDC2E7
MKLTKEQSDILYIVKGIGIFTVVIGHSWGILVGLTKPYFYHMPLFFFIGGFFLSGEEPIKAATRTIKKITTYLIITYIIIGVASEIISSFYEVDFGTPFSTDTIRTVVATLEHNFHNNELFFVGWFLFAYALANITSEIILSLLLKIKNNSLKKAAPIITAIILGVVSVNFTAHIYKNSELQIYNLISQVLYASMFMLIGYSIRNIALNFKNNMLSIVLFALVVLLYLTGVAKQMIMSWSTYPSGFIISSIVALSCILLIFFAAQHINKTVLSAFFIDAGKYSRNIMSYHLCIFVMLDICFSTIGLWDMKNTKTLSHYQSSYSQLLYPFIAAVVPLYIAKILSKGKSKIISITSQ